ncbi:hypothetical protein [Sphingomonas sp. PB4P5]|uniref:hypothetical protein n=1 Tax=Parasphingomonas puruogangriensis TaxID=3096155 RepID=UPI003FA74DD9
MVMLNVRFPLSLGNVEDLLFERGIDICHETVRMGQQPDREQSPAVPTTRGGNDQVRCLKLLQKFASVHANVHNNFNRERHLVDRQTYKEHRSAALPKRGQIAQLGGCT